MSNVTFTRTLDSDAIYDSSLVDEVYYNENTGDLYVDLDGPIYKYSNVPVHVVDDFESAYSAGSFYNENIKGKYSSEDLGSWARITYNEVEVEPKPVTIPGPIYAQGGVISVSTAGTAQAQFSLKPFTENGKVEGVERDYAVTFEVSGLAGKRVHRLKAFSVDKAVDTVTNLGKSLDLTFVPREVVITL